MWVSHARLGVLVSPGVKFYVVDAGCLIRGVSYGYWLLLISPALHTHTHTGL